MKFMYIVLSNTLSQANKTMMASNVTLAIDESLELSRITVLSPPSIVNGEVKNLANDVI